MTNKYIKNNGNGNFKVTIPFEINTYESWSVITQIVTPETFEDCTLINTVDFEGSDIKSFKLDLNSAGHLILHLSTNGDTYNYNLISSNELEPNNQIYYIEVAWSGTIYTVKVSTNNVDWVSFIQQDNTSILYSNLVYINFIQTIDSNYFKGKLDINSTKLVKKTSNDSDNVTIFSGDTASNAGYINYGTTITNNVASNFNTDKYIICNGSELNSDYIKIITKIHVNTNSSERQPVIVNKDLKGIYVLYGKIAFSTSTTGNDILSYSPGPHAISTDKDYYVGYLYQLYNGRYTHSLYIMEDDGYYNDYTELPDFNSQCAKSWMNQGSINIDTNVFDDLIYIGSNKDKYLDGTIDLSNTVISSNVVTYSISKPGFSETKSSNVRCYIPQGGTKILNTSSETVTDISLDPMVKFSISAQDIDDQTPIDLTNATITYTVTNSNYGSNDTNYYKQTTDKTTIYVLPGSTVTYRISDVFAYANNSKTVTNIISDTEDIIDLTCNRYYTFTVNAVTYRSGWVNLNSESTFLITSGNVTSNTNTMQVKYGRPVSYEVYNNNYNMTYAESLGNLYENKTVNIEFDSSLYYSKLTADGILETNYINHMYLNYIIPENTFISKNQNGVHVVNNRLYYSRINSDGSLSTNTIPLESSSSGNYATDWTALGYNCAMRDNKVYSIHINSTSNYYAKQLTLPSEDYVDGYVLQATGSDYYSALTSNGDLYYGDHDGTPSLISSNVTKMYGTGGFNYSYESYGYYVNDYGLYCYDRNNTSTLLSSNTNWTTLTKNFGICDGKLYLMIDTTLSQIGTDTDWIDVGYDNNLSYNSNNNSWSSGYVFAIKGNNVVKLQLSGSLASPTPIITQFTPSGDYSKLNYGYELTESSSTTVEQWSHTFTSKKNATKNYDLYHLSPNLTPALNPYLIFTGKYVIDLSGRMYTYYTISNSTYDLCDIAILHLGTVEKIDHL